MMNNKGSVTVTALVVSGIIAVGYMGLMLWSALNPPSFEKIQLGALDIGTKDSELSSSFKYPSGFVPGIVLLYGDDMTLDDLKLHIIITQNNRLHPTRGS
jgi:hypothetical protein